jgi:hypothetical protein
MEGGGKAQSVQRLGNELDDWGLNPGGVNEVTSPLPYSNQTGSGAHPTSYPMNAGAFFTLVVKRPGHEADYSPPSSAEIKNVWSYTSTPSIYLH